MLRAAWKSLLGRRLRLVMSTFAIVLGVAFVAGTLVFTDTLSKSFTAIFDNSVGDVVVQPQGAAGDVGSSAVTIPGALVDRLAAVPGAARADGNVVSVGVYLVGRDNKVVGGPGPPGFAFSDGEAPAANGVEPLQVVEGRRPSGTGEVALDVRAAQRAGYRIGDTVRLVSASRRALLTPRLVGLADFPGGGSLNGATASLWETRAAQELFLGGRDAFTTIWVTAAPGTSQSELRDRVAIALPDGVEAVTGDTAAQASASDLLQAISFITVFLLVFAGIALVVGSFLIVNTFSILVAQRSRELALLRALGASRRQVTGSVLFEALVVGLVGSTLGLGLGVLLAIGIRALFAAFGLDLSQTPLVFAPRTVLASYAVGVLVTVVAAYLPARRSGRIAPIEALRDDVAMPASTLRRRFATGSAVTALGVALGAVGLLADVPHTGYWVGAGALLALLGVAAASPVLAQPFLRLSAAVYARGFGSVGVLAGQNTLRNPRWTAAAASALMIGLALVTTMTVAGASAKASVDDTVSRNFVGDLVVSNAFGQGFSPSVTAALRRTPGVDQVVRVRYASMRRDGQRDFVLGTDPARVRTVARVRMVRGSLDALTDRTVLVSTRRAEKEGLALGDTVRLQGPAGTRSYTVAGVYERNPVLGAGFALTVDALRKAGFVDQDNAAYVTVRPGVDPATVQRTVERETAALPTVTVKNQREFATEQRAPIDRLLLLIYALLGLALVIAVLGVVNTLGLSIIERTREIGLLRAIGLSRRQLRLMVMLESVAICLLGALIGIGMGLAFGTALMASLRDEGLEVTRVPWPSLGGYLVASALVGVLAAVVPARRAARLDVLRAIAAE